MVSDATIGPLRRSPETAATTGDFAPRRETEERMTSDDRINKGRPQQPREQASAESEPQRKPPAPKPTPIETLEWRGAGVCGDRHTD